MKVLVFGENVELMEALPATLNRAGFEVHLITTKIKMKRSKYIAKFIHAPSSSRLIELAVEQSKENYELIVVSDDYTQKRILDSDLPAEKKASLLPVLGPENFEHLSSKIGLSRVLKRHNIATPDFLIADNLDEVAHAVQTLGCPVLIKPDTSSGGVGIYECENSDLTNFRKEKTVYPVLVQKKIEGNIIDLSGFFQSGKLIFFGYSEFITLPKNNYGPSILRKYRKTASIEAAVINQLNEVGSALGLNGFANITCIEALSDGKLYFFEADTRPNVWIEHQKYFEEDPAVKIRNYFIHGITLQAAPEQEKMQGKEYFLVPYLPRMSFIDIVKNRYQCRKYYENYLGRNVLIEKLVHGFMLFSIRTIKPLFPKHMWLSLKRVGNFLGILSAPR